MPLLEPGGATSGRLFSRLMKAGERSGEVLAPGTSVGAWRIGDALGSGGTATVYLADRADGQFEQQVALKIVRPSQRLIDSFRRERQILAELAHPTIARLIDGGELPDGRLWFAMEAVFGERIDHFVRTRRLALLDRLALFEQVCEAIEYAHSRLLVHRDIKPSNILVDQSGRARLLDFGIALTDSSREEGGDHAMTPNYASPEQLRGEPITIASDIYQLGQLLAVLVGLNQGFCDTLPKQPPPVVARELAAIVATATAERSEDRYPTVAALHDDLRALRVRRPVSVIDERRYRVARLLERHAVAFTIATVAVTAIGVLITVSALQLRRERDHAMAAAARSEAANEFLNSMFSAPAEKLTAQQILSSGAQRLKDAGFGRPEFDTAIGINLATMYMQMVEYAKAEEVLTSLPAAALDTLPADAPERARIASTLGYLAYVRSDYGEAEQRFMEAEAAATRVRDAQERETELGILRFRQAVFSSRTGNLELAQKQAVESLELLRRTRGDDDIQTAKAWNSLGVVAKTREDLKSAVAAYEKSYDIYVRRYGSTYPLSIGTADNLAEALMLNGDNERAYSILSESNARIRAFGSERSLFLGLNLDLMSQVLLNLHQPQRALQVAEEADAILVERLGPTHNFRSFTLITSGKAKLELGRNDEALTDLRTALELRRQVFGSSHPAVADALQNLGAACAQAGEATAAVPLLRESLDIRRKTLPGGSVSIPRTRLLLAESLIKLHRSDDARSQLAAVAREFQLARDVHSKDREKLSSLDAVLVANTKGALPSSEDAQSLLRQSSMSCRIE